MKTTRFIISLLLLGTMCFSCEDSLTKDYPELKTYFVKDRVQQRNVYNLAIAGIDKEVYEAAMQCSGAKSISVNAKARINNERLEEYNDYYSSSFVAMPSSVYTLVNSEVSFKSLEEPGIFKVEIDIQKLADEIGYGETEYVIPLELYDSGNIGVNDKKNYVLIKPALFAPYVEMEETGVIETVLGKGEVAELTIPVKLPFKTPVPVTFDIEVDESLLDEYNTGNGTSLDLFPAANYTLLTDGFVIKEGEQSVVVRYELKDGGLDFGTYALPLRLKDTDPFPIGGETAVGGEATLIYIITYLPEEIDNSRWIVLQGDEFTSQTDGQGIPGLLDGNPNTYWQATGTYLDQYDIIFDMREIYEIARFEVIRRGNVSSSGQGTNNIRIEVSDDGITWTESEIITTTYLPGVWQGINITPIQGRYLKYVQFTAGFRHMAGFRIRGEKVE